MPIIINVVVASSNSRAIVALTKHSRKICELVAHVCGYRADEVSLYPRYLTESEEVGSENIKPLYIEAEIGAHPDPEWYVRERSAHWVRDGLLEYHEFKHIAFSVWLKHHMSSSYAEH